MLNNLISNLTNSGVVETTSISTTVAVTTMLVAFVLGVIISIFNIKDASWERALENVEKINSQTQCKAQLFDLNDHETLRKEINESVIFTNATNVGMGKLEGKMVLPDTSYLRKDLIVSDVIYMPEKTKLLEEAEKIGCKTINGLGMMLYQGAASFKLWTDQDMPIDVVKEALDF